MNENGIERNGPHVLAVCDNTPARNDDAHERAGLSTYNLEEAQHINLPDQDIPEFYGRLVKTERMIAGVRCTYVVPRHISRSGTLGQRRTFADVLLLLGRHRVSPPSWTQGQ